METVIYPFDINIFLKLAKFEILASLIAVFCLFFKDTSKTSFKVLVYGALAWLFMIAWVQVNSTEFLVSDSYSINPIQTLTRFLSIVLTILVLRFTDTKLSSKQYSLIFFSLSLFALSQTLILQVANPIVTGIFICISYYFYKKKLVNFSSCIPKISFTLILFSLYGLLDMHHPIARVVYSSYLLIGYFVLGIGGMYWDRLETHKYRLFYFMYVGLFLIHLVSSSLAFLMVYRDISFGLTMLMGMQFFMIWVLLMFTFSHYVNKSKSPNLSSLMFLALSFLCVYYSVPTKESYVFLGYNSIFLTTLLAYFISGDSNYKTRELATLFLGSFGLAISGYIILPQIYHERLYPLLLMLALALIISGICIVKQKATHIFKAPILLCSLLVLIPVNELKEIAADSYTRFMDVRDELDHLLKITDSTSGLE
ncbi:MAG: hypothetical protein KC646_03355 [Candidatus Cloacimonetes bacterium]|nr:hypothetical protein [Candidatus Cloacimonadota bacterium]